MRLIFEKSKKGKKGVTLPRCDIPEKKNIIPEKFLRKKEMRLPQLTEPEVVRHYTNLSSLNFHIDKGFYPLGSCTMKYNPKINEDLARHPCFLNLHPLQSEDTVQGALKLMYELQELLCRISGMDAVSLQPSAGASGEFTALLIAKKYFKVKGEERKRVLLPDSAHGTNPASCTLAGFIPEEIKSDEEGLCNITELKKKIGKDVAMIMLTVPNTLGLFERRIKEISRIAEEEGVLLYLDGANMNAFLGIVLPSEMGFHLVHFNLHKTFSTPHGSGGPGGGALGVKKFLEEFLPVPVIRKKDDKYYLEWNLKHTIGKVHTFYGNFNVNIKAYTYIRMMGKDGLRKVAETSIINANYLKEILKDYYDLPYKSRCMHEFVLSGAKQKRETGVRTLNIAKRLLDYGFHPPTIYFPLIVQEALMIEPTETESKDTLDKFAEALINIAKECKEAPDKVLNAPHNMPVKRVDEARASRELDVNYFAK